MSSKSLQSFVDAADSAWVAGCSNTVELCRKALADLARADESELWLAALRAERPASRELYRHPEHGFVLLAHAETQDLYRAPHDHGRAWVVYSVQSGALKVGSYRKVVNSAGDVSLVQVGQDVIHAGEARVYLPGDIHDTKCLSETALLFRFTERDLRHEDQVEGKVTRFVRCEDRWTVAR